MTRSVIKAFTDRFCSSGSLSQPVVVYLIDVGYSVINQSLPQLTLEWVIFFNRYNNQSQLVKALLYRGF